MGISTDVSSKRICLPPEKLIFALLCWDFPFYIVCKICLTMSIKKKGFILFASYIYHQILTFLSVFCFSYPLNDPAETVNEIGASIRKVMGGTSGIM